MKILLRLALVSLVAAAPAAAQRVIELKMADGAVVMEAPPDMTALQTAAAGGEAQPDAANSPRAQKLKALTFDRRPSTILETWSSPPPEPPEPDEDAEDAEASPAEPDAGAPASQPVAEDGETETDEAEAGEDAGESVETAEEDAEGAPPADATEATNDAASAAADAAKAAAEEAKRKAFEAKLLDHELKLFQRDVTLGRWDAVRDYLAGIEEAEAKAGYAQLLTSLVKGPPKTPAPAPQHLEVNAYEPADVVGLVGAAPTGLEPADAKKLGTIVKQCVDGGSLIEACVEAFREALAGDAYAATPLFVARTLTEAGFPVEAGAFLPTPEEAIAGDERAALNLLARHYVALDAKDSSTAHLEAAWKVTQAALATGEIEDDEKTEALKRAVALAPRLRDELGQRWLDESFTARPERGMEILATIGAGVSKGLAMEPQDAAGRQASLELQSTAATALLAAAPERAEEWSGTLGLLATNWLKEAAHSYQFDSSTTRGPVMQRDPFGNFFYTSYGPQVNRNAPKAIPTDAILDVRPSDTWLDRVAPGLRTRIDMVTAQLLLKVKAEAEAFPCIERLAGSHPERATELVEEFLRVWAENHDPNSDNRRRNSYVYFYGFEERANAIPLTRSKQERNLTELAGWIERLRALPIDGVDERLVANAFVAAHSTAEVYRIETIERVFGGLDTLEPATLAELVQRMRTNLAEVWRDPAVQKDKGTRRRQRDIQREVERGYDVAAAVVERAQEDHPDDWALQLARASVMHDRNNYEQEIATSSEFAGRREEAFVEFARAAELYREALADLTESDETTQVHETWFYASLGACDARAIDSRKQTADAQIGMIRDALAALPGEAGERHRATFANNLFTRMGSLDPSVKFRYVRAGLEVVGDHERARDAREVFDYYQDLVTEIRLETRVDGDARVGHEEPFGLFVDLVHTREIERESGGFSKYLVNQNNQAYSYNYGRPVEDYRDKFEEAAREALAESFEVLSITFNHPDAGSRALERYGWRKTPYAYVLMRARGAEIDRVPALRLDLDFLDTTGYAVLPVESPTVPIDCGGASGVPERAVEGLELVQTLDERQASEGKLVLEIKATARGLVPGLERLVDLDPDGFEVASVDDQGVSVSQFDEEEGGDAIVSDRTWLVSLRAAEGLAELPTTFAFATPRAEDVETVYQRYDDADLVSVDPVVDLNARYGERSPAPFLKWGLGLALAAVALVAGFVLLRPRGRAEREGGLRMPERISPFTVIGLLREIEGANGMTDAERSELRRSIEELEHGYFRNGASDHPDLERVAARWLARVS